MLLYQPAETTQHVQYEHSMENKQFIMWLARRIWERLWFLWRTLVISRVTMSNVKLMLRFQIIVAKFPTISAEEIQKVAGNVKNKQKHCKLKSGCGLMFGKIGLTFPLLFLLPLSGLKTWQKYDVSVFFQVVRNVDKKRSLLLKSKDILPSVKLHFNLHVSLQTARKINNRLKFK